MKTTVVFRIERDGSVLAVFPNEIADPNGNLTCYARIGQHGAADRRYVIDETRPATPKQFRDLKNELISLGYELEIKNRMPKELTK